MDFDVRTWPVGINNIAQRVTVINIINHKSIPDESF